MALMLAVNRRLVCGRIMVAGAALSAAAIKASPLLIHAGLSPCRRKLWLMACQSAVSTLGAPRGGGGGGGGVPCLGVGQLCMERKHCT